MVQQAVAVGAEHRHRAGRFQQGLLPSCALAAHFVPVPRVPTLLSPFVTTVPLQVLAAEIAQARGYDVDKPRNLAKSVTVE